MGQEAKSNGQINVLDNKSFNALTYETVQNLFSYLQR